MNSVDDDNITVTQLIKRWVRVTFTEHKEEMDKSKRGPWGHEHELGLWEQTHVVLVVVVA